jgi:predicted RNA-binding Zn ribbon-like protein
VRVLNSALRRAALSPRFSVTAPARWTTELATAGVDGALGRLLGVVLETMADGTWPRLKVCLNDGCQWAFYDQSRARSGKWCSMGVCGNRAKQRAWRSRQAEAGTAG